ncbi:hypothetical protein GW17_00030626, partial [Ensete ventricosum]
MTSRGPGSSEEGAQQLPVECFGSLGQDDRVRAGLLCLDVARKLFDERKKGKARIFFVGQGGCRPTQELVYSEGGKPRSSSGVLPFPRPCFSTGFQKLVRSLKSLSQHLLFYKEEDEEVDMEIGFPTDVQHVAHIGWDGFNGMSSKTSWDKPPPEFLTLPPFSLKQFELAMAAQAGVPPPPPPSHGPGGSWPHLAPCCCIRTSSLRLGHIPRDDKGKAGCTDKLPSHRYKTLVS